METLGLPANAVGMGRAVLDESLAFARAHGLLADTRVRDRLEHMARKLRSARLLCLKAGWLADQERPNILEASMCKAVAAGVAVAGAGVAASVGVGSSSPQPASSNASTSSSPKLYLIGLFHRLICLITLSIPYFP